MIILKDTIGGNRMYQGLASELYSKLTSDEWNLVSYYIKKADELGEVGKESRARDELQNAVDVAKAQGEYNAAGKIEYYLRFY